MLRIHRENRRPLVTLIHRTACETDSVLSNLMFNNSAQCVGVRLAQVGRSAYLKKACGAQCHLPYRIRGTRQWIGGTRAESPRCRLLQKSLSDRGRCSQLVREAGPQTHHRLIEFDRGSVPLVLHQGLTPTAPRNAAISRTVALPVFGSGWGRCTTIRSDLFEPLGLCLGTWPGGYDFVPASHIFLIRLDRNFYYPAKIHRALGHNIGYGVTLARNILAVG